MFSQIYLNYLSNYVPNTWNYEHGCSQCDKDILDLSQLKVRTVIHFYFNLPLVHFCCVVQQKGLERMRHCGLPASISFCLDSRSGTQLALFQQISQLVGNVHITLIINNVPAGPFGLI